MMNLSNLFFTLHYLLKGDTGYGNAINVKRTLQGYARAGMAGIMIEDQVSPKRCGHVAGKSVVSFDEAVQRVKAACDARYVRYSTSSSCAFCFLLDR